jgi:hypothetical protein
MSKQHASILSSSFPGHSRGVRTGQRDSAGIGHGNELIQNFLFSLLISMPRHHPYGILHAACKGKATQAVKKRSPHLLRERSHFGIGCHKTPPPKEKEKGQWGSGGLQA